MDLKTWASGIGKTLSALRKRYSGGGGKKGRARGAGKRFGHSHGPSQDVPPAVVVNVEAPVASAVAEPERAGE